MAFGAWIRWTLFAFYVSLFFILPLVMLWDLTGFYVGAALALGFLWWMHFRAADRLLERLGAHRSTSAELPNVVAVIAEYSRRLRISAPRIAVIETPALNLAVFGFSRKNSYLVLTRGALNTLSRDELGTALGRELAYLWYGDIACESWLSQFMAVVDRLVGPIRPRNPAPQRSFYTFKLFLRQILVYPLALFPIFILKGPRDAGELDLKATRLTRDPKAFAEALRRMEAFRERIPFQTPFSCRHLFLLPPPTKDPLARVFFGESSLALRIEGLEQLMHVVNLT